MRLVVSGVSLAASRSRSAPAPLAKTPTARRRRQWYFYVFLCISMYFYVFLCISMYFYVFLCFSMYFCVFLCISMEHLPRGGGSGISMCFNVLLEIFLVPFKKICADTTCTLAIMMRRCCCGKNEFCSIHTVQCAYIAADPFDFGLSLFCRS